jgi:hypothetical protein
MKAWAPILLVLTVSPAFAETLTLSCRYKANATTLLIQLDAGRGTVFVNRRQYPQPRLVADQHGLRFDLTLQADPSRSLRYTISRFDGSLSVLGVPAGRQVYVGICEKVGGSDKRWGRQWYLREYDESWAWDAYKFSPEAQERLLVGFFNENIGPKNKIDVARLQSELRKQGYDPGPPDGIFGTQTKKALTAYFAKYLAKDAASRQEALPNEYPKFNRYEVGRASSRPEATDGQGGAFMTPPSEPNRLPSEASPPSGYAASARPDAAPEPRELAVPPPLAPEAEARIPQLDPKVAVRVFLERDQAIRDRDEYRKQRDEVAEKYADTIKDLRKSREAWRQLRDDMLRNRRVLEGMLGKKITNQDEYDSDQADRREGGIVSLSFAIADALGERLRRFHQSTLGFCAELGYRC